MVQFLNSISRKEDPRLAVGSVSVGYLHCLCGIFVSEFAALKILALTKFPGGKGWEGSLGRQ